MRRGASAESDDVGFNGGVNSAMSPLFYFSETISTDEWHIR